MDNNKQIEVFKSEGVAQAKTWAHLCEADLKRRAMAAANERNAAELWSLTEAHLTLHGSAGAKVSRNTREAYRTGLKDLCKAWEGENLLRPSRDAAVIWLRELEDQGRKPATIRVKLAAARALYKALRWAGATNAVPFSDATPAKDKTAPWDKRQPYSLEDVDRLAAVAGPQDRAMVLLGAHAGLRVSEILDLTWRDIDLGNNALMVRNGKGGKARRVGLSDSLVRVLAELRQSSDAGQDARLYPFTVVNARYRIRQLCKRAGVDYRGMHALRHQAGTRLFRETHSLENVARHLGHSGLETARIYAKWSDETLKATIKAW
jgi:integrase/recombinase XerC